ncbi:MAG: hypothetical protein LLG40_10590 [Deltaproteobacteria bacterium]|nr:hypothetical protein [Deltaproteobacteria bacterium]
MKKHQIEKELSTRAFIVLRKLGVPYPVPEDFNVEAAKDRLRREMQSGVIRPGSFKNFGITTFAELHTWSTH